MAKKAVFFVAHDDDLILSSGGLIQKLLSDGTEVSVVLFTNGETSHQIVLGIEKEPTPEEVARARRVEFLNATCFLGVPLKDIVFLDFPTRQVGDRISDGEKKVFSLLKNFGPNDFVYFHFPDAHQDHRGVNKIVLNVLRRLPKREQPAARQFFIWSKELAQGRSDVYPDLAPEIPKEALSILLTDHQNMMKRRALFEMKSQIQVWPYFEWQPQKAPILDAEFIKYFLRGEELFLAL